ncbi:MAG: PGF-pre-PGF domain-containing protein, partial [Chloroflexi bacterium]|nr:PGF-pre-PGF domain-containing protein [Chloroflexota bacterium]
NLAASTEGGKQDAAVDIIGDLAASTEGGKQDAATNIIGDLGVSEDAVQQDAAVDIIGNLGNSQDVGQQDAAADIIVDLVVSTEGDQNDSALNIMEGLATSTDTSQNEAVVSIGENAASSPADAAQITELFNEVVNDPTALANIQLAHQIIVKGNTPVVGDKGWQPTGSPAPIDAILTRFGEPIEDAHIEVLDVETLPDGVPQLSAELTVNSMFTLKPENFDQEDVVTNHVTFFVEKSWLEENGIHPWSVQFNRYDPVEDLWVPLIGKLSSEDDERIFYTVAPPSFSLWAITGAAEPAPIRFEATNLQMNPALPEDGENVQITVQVSNLTNDTAEYNAVLWVNSDVETSQNVTIAGNSSESISFTTTFNAGEFDLRVGKQLRTVLVASAIVRGDVGEEDVEIPQDQDFQVPTVSEDDDNNVLLPIIIGAVVIAALVFFVIFDFVRRRRTLT